MTLDFRKGSPDYIRSVPIHAGIVPDMPSEVRNEGLELRDEGLELRDEGLELRVGLFCNEMPQTVITEAYNYRLDVIELMGDESQTYIDNLKRTLIPDILPNIDIIKNS